MQVTLVKAENPRAYFDPMLPVVAEVVDVPQHGPLGAQGPWPRSAPSSPQRRR